MSRYPWSVIVRALVFFLPLLALYLFSRWSAEQVAGQAHRGDSALGIAVLLGAMTLVMLLGFCVDFVVQVKRRRTFNWLIDILLIVLLMTPFGWFACNWFGGGECKVCQVPMMVFATVLEWLGL
ncbi:hypothetical protein [Stenotrophomonas sp. Iso1]|uniref:hypothetical protein n=1 Tax=Stenotrophomonas sp. Iso1 TaxID=2977283 RepID=UPI0022B7BCAF|nr:hypothetical protein [Stenotrophomonas sp. Iso1]